MKRAVLIFGLLLLLGVLGTSTALADDPPPPPPLNVDINITGDNTQTDVNVNGDNSTVTVNGQVPFVTYSSCVDYNDQWMREALKTLQAAIDAKGTAIIQVHDGLVITIDSVAMLITISEKQKEFNTQTQDEINGLCTMLDALRADLTKDSSLTAEQLTTLNQLLTAIGNRVDSLQASLAALGETTAQRDMALAETTAQRDTALADKIDALSNDLQDQADTLSKDLVDSIACITTAYQADDSMLCDEITAVAARDIAKDKSLQDRIDKCAIVIIILAALTMIALMLSIAALLRKRTQKPQ